ncbi:2-oxoacid ferredoxin oxidoreductase [Patescibacteria group bacterium]|nr:2-oxoacid ferredoxin oxidoreductase [Patescibacteria group bacterium]
MTTLSELATPYTPNWCPGCGNMSLWAAFKNAAVQEGWDNTNTALAAGIGCHGHIVNFTKITSLEGLHGRPIPVATGIKLSDHKLNVFAFTGDGDCLGEGGNHFIHACRRNHDITIVIHDNGLYALTTGQTSPVSPHGFVSKSTPQGNLDNPLWPLQLAIAAGATFVARGYAGHIKELTELFVKANNHKGISVLDVLQPCVTFNKVCTHETYQQNTYYLDGSHDKTDKEAAFIKSMEWGEKKIPLGVFYEVQQDTYESQLPQLKDKPLVMRSPVYEGTEKLLKGYI